MPEYQIVVYKKLNWKHVGIVAFALIIIGVGIFLSIKFANGKNYMKDDKNKPIAEEIDAEETMEPNVKETPIPKMNKIPMYTVLGKENVDNVYSSTEDNKRVFLTFDDGPSSNITPLILDVLKDNNIKATFFTLGSRVEQNPQIVKRAYEEGHFIGNHGYSHVYSSIYSSWDALYEEYNKTEEIIRNAIEVSEYSSRLFRFPGGSVGGKYHTVKKQYISLLDQHGVYYLDWNCLNEDATGNRTEEQLVQFIKDTSIGKNSVVVLMHDAGDKILTYETLQEVIDYFKDEGYTFYNFYDLIECEMVEESKELSIDE